MGIKKPLLYITPGAKRRNQRYNKSNTQYKNNINNRSTNIIKILKQWKKVKKVQNLNNKLKKYKTDCICVDDGYLLHSICLFWGI